VLGQEKARENDHCAQPQNKRCALCYDRESSGPDGARAQVRLLGSHERGESFGLGHGSGCTFRVSCGASRRTVCLAAGAP
jgi:hypothetical protein